MKTAMKLLAAGDSFTNGMELTNPNLAWPYVLADKLGMTATNLGFDGSSNSRIVKSVVTADVKKYDLVIVAWSHYDRLTMADEMGIWDTWPGGQRTCYREAKFRIDIILIIYITQVRTICQPTHFKQAPFCISAKFTFT